MICHLQLHKFIFMDVRTEDLYFFKRFLKLDQDVWNATKQITMHHNHRFYFRRHHHHQHHYHEKLRLKNY